MLTIQSWNSIFHLPEENCWSRLGNSVWQDQDVGFCPDRSLLFSLSVPVHQPWITTIKLSVSTCCLTIDKVGLEALVLVRQVMPVAGYQTPINHTWNMKHETCRPLVLLYYMRLSSFASICAPLTDVTWLVIHNWWSNYIWSPVNSQVASQLLSESDRAPWLGSLQTDCCLSNFVRYSQLQHHYQY